MDGAEAAERVPDPRGSGGVLHEQPSMRSTESPSDDMASLTRDRGIMNSAAPW